MTHKVNMGIAKRIANTVINNHHIKIEESLCSRFRTPKSDCSLCVNLCPVGAVRLTEGKPEITEACIDCGVCYSVCPNSVFKIGGRDDRKIISEIKDKVKKKSEDEKIRRCEERSFSASQPLDFLISCERGASEADLILPCLSRLTEVLLLEPILIGIHRIEILQPPCQEGCPLSKASPHINTIMQRIFYIYEMLGKRNALHVTHCTLSSTETRTARPGSLKSQNSDDKTLSRREFLGTIKTRSAEIVAASLLDIKPETKTKEAEATFRDVCFRKLENPKRSLLLKYIQGIFQTQNSPASLREAGRAEPRTINRVDIPSKDAILAEIEIASGCTGCGVCIKLCPTGALINRETDERFYLGFKADLCTNCQVCVKACMYGAIKIKDAVSMNLLLAPTESRLFEAAKKTCPVCRLGFIGTDSEFCPLCVDRSKKQTSLIQNLIKEES
jgi:ferredoxin